MKILLINKFLHPNGGAETYMFRLGKALTRRGHAVEYFGMAHENRMVGNRAEAYTSAMDFRSGAKLSHALKVIYSLEARRRIRRVLEDFQPDVCHLNNFNFQLTPSILLEIRKWSRERSHPCKILYTAHDYQLVCPNHMCRNQNGNCEACLDGNFWNCVNMRCIHGSLPKSLIGAMEGMFWRRVGVYKEIDTVICCSHFLQTKLERHPHLTGKTVVMHNFTGNVLQTKTTQGEYVLYFGRFTPEKGIDTLMQAARELPQIPFVFAGSGELKDAPNIRSAGFQSGAALQTLIQNARFTVCPSEWYENCPFSVLESLTQGTPVLAANIGGLPELISNENGALFESGNVEDLKEKILRLWQDTPRVSKSGFATADTYAEKLEILYGGSL